MSKKLKPKLLIFWLLFAWLCPHLILNSQPKNPKRHLIDLAKNLSNSPLDPKILESKSLSELWILRNTIFARHGRPFKTYELHHYFMSTGWYKPNDKYSDNLLSQTELNNAQLILKAEKKLRQQNYLRRNNQKQLNFGNVLNQIQYANFSEAEIEKLSRDGFLVIPSQYQQLFHLYENNDYLGVPSFITVDAVLQLYHLFFDMTLRNIEQKFLFNKVKQLCQQMIKHSDEISRDLVAPIIKQAAQRNKIYFSIPYYFISKGKLRLQGQALSLAKKELNLCQEKAPWIDSPYLGRKFDYSQFIPRGHYTRNSTLTSYFKAMMWFGLAGIEIKDDRQLIQALLITQHLYTEKIMGKLLIELWRDIYEPTVFYVGLADDLGPDDFKAAITQVFGQKPDYNSFNNPEKLAQVRKILAKRFKEKTKITGFGEWGKQKPQFRVMGQRFIPDSEIFQRLTKIQKRSFPNGLDIMAGFGSKTAKELMLTELKSTWEKWPDYPQELDKIIAEYSQLSPQEWQQNLYYYWLYSLKSLIELKNQPKLPFFMQNKTWERKSLSTALASWAELRHNTILYAKPSGGAECGGDGEEIKVWFPEPPKGYVEPNLEFYQRLLSLISFTRDELTKRQMIDPKMSSLANQFIELVEFLKNVTVKELANQSLTLEEYKQIQKLGSLLDNLTLSVLLEEAQFAEWTQVEGPDKNMPVIADVHTYNDAALEVGVGKADEIYVIVEIGGKLKLTRGAVFSYYEFTWPASDRLTDKKWQGILKQGKAPELPGWIQKYRLKNKTKVRHPNQRDRFFNDQKWSTEPGWKMIYYDTGC